MDLKDDGETGGQTINVTNPLAERQLLRPIQIFYIFFIQSVNGQHLFFIIHVCANQTRRSARRSCR